MITQARRALEYLPPDNLLSRFRANWTMGMATSSGENVRQPAGSMPKPYPSLRRLGIFSTPVWLHSAWARYRN